MAKNYLNFMFFLLLIFNINCLENKKNENYLESEIDEDTMGAFNIYKTKHRKAYSSPDEEKKRTQIFRDNLYRIQNHNEQNSDYKQGVGPYSDLTTEEFQSRVLMDPAITKNLLNTFKTRSHKTSRRNARISPAFVEEKKIYKKFLLTNKPTIGKNYTNLYSPPADQGTKCGSCWAFATTAAIEGNLMLNRNRNVRLSNQYLIDCDSSDYGCSGGGLDTALDYILANGIPTNDNYPYKAVGQTCNKTAILNNLFVVDGYDYCFNDFFPACDGGKWQTMLDKGPISTLIDGTNLQNYKSGYYTGPCLVPNHAIVIVGYGTDANGVKYLICRNDFGPGWGENGYFRIKRDFLNMNSCFAEALAVLPLVK